MGDQLATLKVLVCLFTASYLVSTPAVCFIAVVGLVPFNIIH